MSTRPSLYTQLQQTILPRLLVALIAVSIILCLCIFYVAQKQVANEQRTYISHLKADLTFTLDSTQQLMEGIAANDLLINSFIDIQQRQNYLPIFFESLRFTRARSFSLGLFQFNGEPLITNNWEGQVPASMANAWQETVLNESKPYNNISGDGAIIAVPVLLADSAEGALVLHIPALQALIYQRDSDANQLILDNEGKILYSNKPAMFRPGSLFDHAAYSGWESESEQWRGLTLISQAPALEAYSNVLWLIPAILITLAFAVIVSVYASSHAAKLSAVTLRQLHDDIQRSTSRKKGGTSTGSENEPAELNEIRTAFNQLIINLSTISLSNRQFSNVLDSLEEILVVQDETGENILANRAYKRYALYYDLSDNTLRDIKADLSADKQSLTGHYASLSDKRPVTLSWRVLPLIDDERKQVGSILVGNDLTQRRVLENQINVISHAMKSATVSILIVDAQEAGFPAIYVNPHFSLITGFDEDEVMGQTFLMLNQMKAEASQLHKIKYALRHGHAFDEMLICHKKDGSVFYNQLILTPVYTEDKLTHFVAFFQDVTDRERTRQYLEDARLKAEESARLKSGFLASMSHEVRTPLHGVSGALQLVNKTPLDSTQKRYVDLAKDSLKNLQHIVDDILDFSKIEAGQLNLEAIPFNLELLIKTIYDQFCISCGEKGLTLKLESDLNGQTMVTGDPVRLRQVLGNLLSNAVKFTSEGTITLRLALTVGDKQKWTLRGDVEDTGIGIAPENLDSIFEVFSQEDVSTTRKFGGTGLGLSISRQLCQLMGGDLTVTSEKGRGSCFSFVMLQGNAEGTQPVQSHNDSQAPAPLLPAKDFCAKILIVEDNEINQLIAREHLSQHKTMTARNGKEALEALNRMKLTFDVILMDCHMPEMDGFETTRRIRAGDAGEKYLNVPVIALTANAMKGDRERCEAAGMDDYISKPFSAEDLLSAVARMC
ncbi:ATP-binding protein [Alteromonas sp. RKMC-009]|uniref:ATP-binding protein n=1 Tax=Alteromonas sp. RKMC-009 TaxID=2267264 RepID=UPI000E69EF6C|nr:ATP-binding protein [Alteromonas sp. RKMC-009]AYA63348.1 response regulator [Alteromonas sp. RKMC-009]